MHELTGPVRLPRAFVARALRFHEIPASAAARVAADADYNRFAVVHNPRIMAVLAEQLQMDEAAIRRALAITTVPCDCVADEPWAVLLSAMLSRAALGRCDREVVGSRGLRKILYPFLNIGRAHLDSLAEKHWCHWESLHESLLLQFSDLLIDLALKTILLEATIIKQTRPEIVGIKTSEFGQNFADYCSKSTFFVQKFYLRYAALSRLLATATLNWQRNTTALLERLERDRDAIASEIIGGKLGLLASIEGTLSDSHDGGQTVLFLAFDCGNQLVYKPRSLIIDTVFERLAGQLESAGISPSLRRLRMVIGDTYGWVEFVRHAPIAGTDEAHDFYYRHGINLALLQLLSGTDFHSENVIAEGSQPVLVDLEALLHPRPRRTTDTRHPDPAEEFLRQSVFASGLLPGWQLVGDGGDEPDLSGLGGGQQAEFYRRMSDVIHRDEKGNVRIIRDRIPVPERDNRLILDGAVVSPLGYVDDLVAGFEAAYQLLHACRAEITGERLIPADCEVRYIALATATYSLALRTSLHPDYMHRTVHRELVAAGLAYRAPYVPWFACLVEAEIDAVIQGDIPKFTANAHKLSIVDHRGVTIPDYLGRTVVESFAEQAAAMGESAMERQSQLIRLAMATLNKPDDPATIIKAMVYPSSEELPEQDFLCEIAEIGEQICAEAICENSVPDWIAVTQGESGRSALAPAGTDIYDGAGGIGLFLAHAGQLLGHAQMLELAHGCGRRIVETLGQEHARPGGIYNGAASTAFGLYGLGRVLAETDWRARAVEELLALRKRIASDPIYDMVGGAAGYAMACLICWRDTGASDLRAAALEAGDFLLKASVEAGAGIGLPPRNADQPLTGFSHGAAGLGYALLHLGQAFSRSDFVSAGLSAFDYEDALRNPAFQGYPDFRHHRESDGSLDSSAWCHGSPGIVLARIAMPTALRREADLGVIEGHLRSALTAPLAPSDSLCHGEIGNAEVLLAAAEMCGGDKDVALARRRFDTAILRKRRVGHWRCGSVPDVFVPGAMIGYAGIGLGLLRVCAPESVPSLLIPSD